MRKQSSQYRRPQNKSSDKFSYDARQSDFFDKITADTSHKYERSKLAQKQNNIVFLERKHENAKNKIKINQSKNN